MPRVATPPRAHHTGVRGGGVQADRHRACRRRRSSKSPAAAVPADALRKGIEIPSAAQVLKTAARAHGGRGGGSKLLAKAERLKFAFLSRTVVGDKVEIRHHFYRFGERARVEVDMVKGDGISNTLLWATGGLGRHEDLVGAETYRRHVRDGGSFRPETGLLSIPLGFANDIKAAAEWQGLTVSGQVSHRGETHYGSGADRGRRTSAMESSST